MRRIGTAILALALMIAFVPAQAAAFSLAPAGQQPVQAPALMPPPGFIK